MFRETASCHGSTQFIFHLLDMFLQASDVLIDDQTGKQMARAIMGTIVVALRLRSDLEAHRAGAMMLGVVDKQMAAAMDRSLTQVCSSCQMQPVVSSGQMACLDFTGFTL